MLYKRQYELRIVRSKLWKYFENPYIWSYLIYFKFIFTIESERL